MKARVKAIFTFDIYVNGEYSNEASYIKGNAMTFKQAIAEAKKHIRNFSANHVQIFLTAGSLAVADVTMFNREITVNDYNNEYTPSETYAVCWGVEYKEEDGESNAIAETASKEDAKELAESESKDNKCRMCVARKSDNKVIAIYDNTTPETPDNNDNTDNTMKANNNLNISDLANWINFQLSTIIEGVSAGYTLGNNNTVWIDKGATVFTVSLATGEEIEIDSDNYATAEDIAKAIISILNNNTPETSNTMNTETKTIVTVSITEDGNKCEYTANGKVLASITYRKEFDKYDVNTPSVGYMTDNVTEAHKACESGINWLLEQGERKAAFNYTFAM